MTTTPPEAPSGPAGPGGSGPDEGPRVTGEEMRDLGRLRRTTYDRKVAGVAGGIARHFDIDPVIVRVAFVVLAFFGGAGLIVYAACWLLLPEDTTNDAKLRLDDRSRTVALVLVGTLALLALLGDSWGGWGFPWPLLIIGLIVLVVINARGPRGAQGPRVGPPPAYYPAGPPTGPPTYAAAVLRDRTNPRKRGPLLFWFTMAVVALGLGALGIADAAGAGVADSAYPALALGVIGVMLVVGAFFGRAGGLILAGFVAMFATAGALAAHEFDAGQIRETPQTAEMVDADYSIGAGEIILDLREVADIAQLDGRTIHLEATFGHLEVILPEGLDAEVEATIDGAGATDLFGSSRDGSNDASFNGAADGPTVTIDAEVVFGEIEVDSEERTAR
ncbi:MAG: PspC domain-containing protein [Actinomycetota bacterium]|nr:PspC domain-containing protein [Actinomycetota bacterium]